jgi:hypothetical protein
MLVNGEIPKGGMVRHKCHNRACCNPAHLELGEAQDNVQDMWDREEGAPKGNAKLTESQVLKIRASSLPSAELAKMYGVTRHHINSIKRGHCWSSL